MTDSSNFREVNSIVKSDFVSALCYHGNALWVGERSGKTLICKKNYGNQEFKKISEILPPLPNYVVKTYIPITEPRSMLIHYLTKAGQPGPVEIVHAGGIRILLPQNASSVSTTFSTNWPKIALTFENTLTIYNFVGSAFVFETSIKSEAKISHVACCNDFLIFYDGAYKKYDFSKKAVEALPDLPISVPTILTMGGNNIICSYKEAMVLFARNPSENKTFPYPADYGQPQRIYGSLRSMYMFYKSKFLRVDLTSKSSPQVFDFDDVKVASMIGTELLVINSDKWGIYGSIRPLSQLKDEMINGNTEPVYNTLSSLPADQCSNCAIGIFALLWKDHKELALELTKRYPWCADVRQLLMLFPEIKLDATPEGRTLVPNGDDVHITKDDLKPAIMKSLQASVELILEKLHKNNPESVDAKCVINSLVQIYTINVETRKFDAIMSHYRKLINVELFEQFYKPLLSKGFPILPCIAVYNTIKGDTTTAMKYWQELYMMSPKSLYLSEASYTIREIIDSKEFIDYLEWLMIKDPTLVDDALLSIKHDQRVVLNFLEINGAKIPGARIRYFNYIVQQPDVIPESTIVSSVFDSCVDTIYKISKGEQTENDLKFTNAYMNGLKDKELLDAVIKELNARIIQLLSKHIDLIDYKEALAKVSADIFDKEIKLCIYKATGNYKEGISVLLKDSGKDIPFDDIEKFCRTSPNPPEAFNQVFSLVPADKIFTSTCSFIKKNILYIDPVETIKHIPRDTDMKRVSEIIRIFFNLLTQRNEELDKQIAVSKSLQAEVTYQLAHEQAKYVTVDEDTKCSVCNKSISVRSVFCILPDGNVCHLNCKPKQFN